MNILEEAQSIIYGDREKTYGKPDKNLNCIAAMWTAYRHSTGRDHITAHDVCMMMALLKIARQAHRYKRDNLVDACGYLALADRIENEVNHPTKKRRK